MKILIIIFGISLFINTILRFKEYGIADYFDGTTKITNILSIITFLSTIISFILIVWNW